MAYVDGFVIPVPDANKDAYRAFSDKWGPWMKELGALSVWECWGDEVPEGEVTDLRRAVDLQPGETVVFAWNVWPDKETRDAAWQKMREIEPEDEMPFDGKRMIFGGFKPISTHD